AGLIASENWMRNYSATPIAKPGVMRMFPSWRQKRGLSESPISFHPITRFSGFVSSHLKSESEPRLRRWLSSDSRLRLTDAERQPSTIARNLSNRKPGHQMENILNQDALDILFHKARSRNAWSDTPVSLDVLQRIYEAVSLGPTSMNCSP